MNNMSKSIQKQHSHGLKTACFPILPITQDSFLPNGIKMTTTINILDKNIVWDCKKSRVWLLQKKQKMNKFWDLKVSCWWFHAALTANLVPFTSQQITIISTDTVMMFKSLIWSLNFIVMILKRSNYSENGMTSAAEGNITIIYWSLLQIQVIITMCVF